MRKVVLQLAVSLDGLIEGPNGEYDWCFTDQDYGLFDFYKRIDALFIGRRSYELMHKIGEEALPGGPVLKEYIFSKTLTEVKPGAILIKGNVEEEVRRIKGEPGKDIWLYGGADLTTSLLNLGLVDELILAVHPIILGKGKSLFQNLVNQVPLKLTGTKTYNTGLVMMSYSINQL